MAGTQTNGVTLAAFRGRGQKEVFVLKNKKTKLLALVLAAMLLVTSLSGCGGAAQSPVQSSPQEKSSSQGTRSEASQPQVESPAPDEDFEETDSESVTSNPEDVEVLSSGSVSRTTVRERLKRLNEKKKAAQEGSGSSQSGESSKAPSSSKSSAGSSKAPASSKSSAGSSKAPASSKSSSASSKPKAEETLRVGPGLADIAQLIGLEAGVEKRRLDCVHGSSIP